MAVVTICSDFGAQKMVSHFFPIYLPRSDGLDAMILFFWMLSFKPTFYSPLSMGTKWKQWHILFSLSPKSLWMTTVAMKLKTLVLWKESYDKPRQYIKKQRQHFSDKGQYSYGFSSSHIWMWQLNDKEDWVQVNWCFQTVMLEKTLESPLESKDIKAVSPTGNQPWICIGRTNAEAEASIIWPPDAKSWLTGKEPNAGKRWGQEY